MKANYKGGEVDVIRFNFASKMADINLKGTDTTVPFSSLTDIKAEKGEPFYMPASRADRPKKYVWAVDNQTGIYYEIVSIGVRKGTVRVQAEQQNILPSFPSHTPIRVNKPIDSVLFVCRIEVPSVKIEGATRFSSQYMLTRIVLAGYAVQFSGGQIRAKNSLPAKIGSLNCVYRRIFKK